MYNKYNTRRFNRYNTSGQFISAGEEQQQQLSQPPPPPPPPFTPSMSDSNEQKDGDVEMNPENESVMGSEDGSRPPWMKNKLSGVKKISNKERRRRQNENLRRLLTPKNALMVLNEMLPNEQLVSQFKVEPVSNNQYYKSPNSQSYCADLTLEGKSYKGYGDNKFAARNTAAEQAIRDMIIKRMNKAVNSDGGSQNGESTDEDPLPMIQLASFALHKLFSEWEYEGHRVPQLKPSSNSASESTTEASEGMRMSQGAGGGGGGAGGAAKKPRELPLNASALHPCMLLTHMRPRLEYRELAVAGDKPQNMLFTMGVDVDGTTYIGKASNKREARKAAARAACQELFNVRFDDVSTANTPLFKQ